MELLLIFLIVGAILIFAIVGFVAAIIFLFRTPPASVPSDDADTAAIASVTPSLLADVLATRRFLEHLRASQKIPDDEFLNLCNYLDKNYPDEIASSPYTSHHFLSSEAKDKPDQLPPNLTAAGVISDEPGDLRAPKILAGSAPITETNVNAALSEEEPLLADLVTDDFEPTSNDSRSRVQENVTRGSRGEPLDRVAPWDQPDPPVREPRRSFAEMIAGFMQEKNMRWGELASGILIVLSAIGLVLSLRNELNNRIPYFSSLLFLLITASIVGAGIYTLRRWKLRNTSRGTLIIGLLLIPLNFVAACVLSSGENRRELSDPWYWTAVIVGLTAFGSLSWFGSRFLLRRFNLALAVCIVGCGGATLIYHRLAEIPGFATSSLRIGLALVPTAVLLLMGANLLSSRTWSKNGWSKRGTNRWLTQGGIAAFSAISAASIWYLSTENVWATSVFLSPLLILISLVVCWLGYAIGLQLEGNDRLTNRSMLGTSLLILGLLLSTLLTLGSLANPSVFTINAVFIGALLGFVGVARRLHGLVPVAWGSLAAGSLIGMNLWLGNLPVDQWIEPMQMRRAIFNGKSGLYLLFFGGMVATVQTLVSTRFGANRVATNFRRMGWVTGGAMFLVGCAIALVASLLNRDSYFDTMTASTLLLLAGVGTTFLSVLRNRRRDLLQAEDRRAAYFESLPAINLAMLALFIMLVGLIHTFVWNPTLSNWLVEITNCWEAKWAWVFAIHGLFFAIASRIERPGADEDVFLYGSCVASIVAIAAAVVIVPLHTGNATFVMALATIAWFLIGTTFRRNGKFNVESTLDAGVPFVASTGVLVSIAAAELIMPPAWGDGFGTRHVMIQAIVLSGWSVVWTVLAIVLPRFASSSWLVSAVPRVEQVVMPHVVALLAGVLVGAMVDSSSSELFATVVGYPSLVNDLSWVAYAMVAMWGAVLFMIFHQPSWIKGLSLIVLWFLSWGLFAAHFEASRSAASALRWLIPGGGFTLALVIGLRQYWMPTWLRTRRLARMRGRSWWHRPITQRLIDFSVLIVVTVALSISTITVAQVMLNSPGSLGGPLPGSLFVGDKIISFGVPLVLVVGMLLSYAVSERRPRLAGVGSVLFQYLAILATVLLILSPHPKLASEYFVKVLHSTAVGMTLFGFAWYWFRDRIHSVSSSIDLSGDSINANSADDHLSSIQLNRRAKQLEIHTLINGVLLTALSVVASIRYYSVPDQSAGWISAIGNLFGLASLAGFSMLALLVTSHFKQGRSLVGRLWLFSWCVLVLLGFMAAASDFFLVPHQPWLAFRIIGWGLIVLGCLQVGCLWYMRLKSYVQPARRNSGVDVSIEAPNRFIGINPGEAVMALKDETNRAPFLISMFASLAFALRMLDSTSGWQYESIVMLMVIVGLIFVGGVVLRLSWLLFVSAFTSLIATGVIVNQGLTPTGQPSWLNLSAITLSVLAIANILAYSYLRYWRKEFVPSQFVMMANLVLLATSIWILAGSLLQTLVPSTGTISYFHHRMGLIVMIVVSALAIASLWNEWRKFWTASFVMFTLGIAITIALLGDPPRSSMRLSLILFASSFVVMLWGFCWGFRRRWLELVNRGGGERLQSLESSMQTQFPAFALAMVGILIPLSFFGILYLFEDRTPRLMVSVVPIFLAIAFACFSNAWERRWLQHVALGLVTIGIMFVSWTDLPPRKVFDSPIPLMVRSLIVLALAMFIYGAAIPGWVRTGDSWLKTFREMAGATCVLAIVCLGSLIGFEWSNFDSVNGSGIEFVEAMTVAVVGLGMVYGLLSISVRPINDPFSLSLNGRKTYVYTAQAVLAGLLLHTFLSMPWLFQFGLKEYWPYIAMVICFAGVGVSRTLASRNLEVLSQPLFNTAATIPIVTAIGYFALSSEADGALLMLVAGLAYLMIAIVTESIPGRVLALVFGNIALWMFYGRFEDFSFLAHPQWWLIPPALSALLAAQFNRRHLTSSQLATIRYVSAAVIYVSSTGEIFISGLGDKLWPPMILAALSVAGILAGIMLQVRAFLYFGILFLLLAMITMVSHAHRQFDHVWPWWAFGIAMGIGILVMFGLFEKRKNEMRGIASHMREWDA